MKNKLWFRIGTVCLAMVMLLTVAAALSYDLNKDGKTNVWDLQLAVNENKSADDQAAALKEALGGTGDELRKNADGKFEIWTELGLYNMASQKVRGATYVLMADIDLGGKDWTPIEDFVGILDGNGHTISNFKITKCGKDKASMGFFSVIDQDSQKIPSVVKNLNLRDVEITAAPSAQYIGLIAGSNRGKVQNCTTTGLVKDTRTTLGTDVYVGTLVGRNNNSTPAGTVASGKNLITATAGSSNKADKVTGLTSQLAMDFADLAEGSKPRHIGIAGYSKAENLDTAMTWQDVSGSIAYKSEAEQERRQGAVDEMHRQGTVQWTVSEELTYTVSGSKTHVHSNVYKVGTTYYGLPYNSVGGGYERAMGIMQEQKDSQGRYVTVKGLEDGVKDDSGKSYGFVQMMGNDCSAAVGWAWGAVSPSRILNEGVRVQTTPYMIPNEYNTPTFGVLPAGGYQTLTSNLPKEKQAVDARDTQSIIALNGGASGMAEYYAKSSRGDALLCVEYDYNAATDTWVKGTGHARMLAYDPMIIRDYKGEIDLQKSYVITHEQGDGLFDNRDANGNYVKYNGYNLKQTSWRIDYKYSLEILLSEEAYKASDKIDKSAGCGWGYVPVTIPAFSAAEVRTPYYDAGYLSETNYHPVILPDTGWYYSNYMIAKATMVITDANGTEVYSKTGYPTGRTTSTENLKLEILFPDAADNLVEGQEYFCTLKIMASNNVEYTKLNNKKFTYPSTEILK